MNCGKRRHISGSCDVCRQHGLVIGIGEVRPSDCSTNHPSEKLDVLSLLLGGQCHESIVVLACLSDSSSQQVIPKFITDTAGCSFGHGVRQGLELFFEDDHRIVVVVMVFADDQITRRTLVTRCVGECLDTRPPLCEQLIDQIVRVDLAKMAET